MESAALTALLAFIVFSHSMNVDAPPESLRFWRRLVIAGAVVFALGAGLFTVTGQVSFWSTGIANRVWIAAALGVSAYSGRFVWLGKLSALKPPAGGDFCGIDYGALCIWLCRQLHTVHLLGSQGMATTIDGLGGHSTCIAGASPRHDCNPERSMPLHRPCHSVRVAVGFRRGTAGCLSGSNRASRCGENGQIQSSRRRCPVDSHLRYSALRTPMGATSYSSIISNERSWSLLMREWRVPSSSPRRAAHLAMQAKERSCSRSIIGFTVPKLKVSVRGVE